MADKSFLTLSREQVLGNLSQSDLREWRKNSNQIQSFNPNDILKQRYYHKDKHVSENYSNGHKIQIGTHGPELKNGNLYISIYHYLEYVCKDPNMYDTIRLGGYLTMQSDKLLKTLSVKYIACKYENYSETINKYELEFLKNEEKSGIFEQYKK